LVEEGGGFCGWQSEGVELGWWVGVAGVLVCHERERRCSEEEEVEEQEVGNPGAGEDGESDCVGSLKWEEGKIWKLVEDGPVMVDTE
jgi:hypothetical protein